MVTPSVATQATSADVAVVATPTTQLQVAPLHPAVHQTATLAVAVVQAAAASVAVVVASEALAVAAVAAEAAVWADADNIKH